jgi:Uma2 family endonuclease
MALPIAQDPAEPFTFADLDAMPDDGRRWELISGSLVVSPAPFGAHQWCAARLFRILDEATPRDTVVVPAPYDWRVEATGESFQPDVTVIRRGDFDPDGPLRATPLLVVEIISPRQEAQDRTFKRSRYEALRVPAYWIVDPAAGPSLTELRLSGHGRYTERSAVSGEQTFATDYPFPVELTPAALAWRG